jgi:hypothetical protein
MVMTETKTTRVQEIAAEIGMSYGVFIGRCLDKGLSFDTANDAWNGVAGKRGYNKLTRATIARILRRTSDEVFGNDPA